MRGFTRTEIQSKPCFVRDSFGKENLTLCSGTFSLFEFHMFCTYLPVLRFTNIFFHLSSHLWVKIKLPTSWAEKKNSYNVQTICQLLKLPITKIYLKKTKTQLTVRPGNKNRRSKPLKKAEENGLLIQQEHWVKFYTQR